MLSGPTDHLKKIQQEKDEVARSKIGRVKAKREKKGKNGKGFQEKNWSWDNSWEEGLRIGIGAHLHSGLGEEMQDNSLIMAIRYW